MPEQKVIILTTEEHQRLHVSLKTIRRLSVTKTLKSEDLLEDMESASQDISRFIRRLRRRWDEMDDE